MTVKEFAKKMLSTVVTAAKKLGKLIIESDSKSVAKVGVLIAATITTIAAAIAYVKNRRHVYCNEDNKSMVDRALQINYADLRNQKALKPTMKKVNKSLNNELRLRKSKKAFRNKNGKTYREFEEIMNSKRRNKRLKENGPVALSELESFARDMEDLEAVEASRKGKTNDFALRRAWENS